MKYKLKISPKALSDIQAAIDYYEGQQKGLGKRFANRIKADSKAMKKVPFAGSIAYDDTRYKVVAKFPYIILYRVIANTIFVARVFNTHQQPFV